MTKDQEKQEQPKEISEEEVLKETPNIEVPKEQPKKEPNPAFSQEVHPAVPAPPPGVNTTPGIPDHPPMHMEKDLSQKQMVALINNNLQGIQNLSKAMSDTIKKLQDVNWTRMNAYEQKSAGFDKRMDNLEGSMLKIVEVLKGGQPQQPQPPQQYQQPPTVDYGPAYQAIPGQPGYDPARNQLSDSLGPVLGDMVMKAIEPKPAVNLFQQIGETLINNQIKAMANPDEDPLRMIGKAVVQKITDQGVNAILAPNAQQSAYDETYMKTKAKQDAKRDAETSSGNPPPE